MKKSLIALAALAASAAFAQSSVTLSGNLDYAWGHIGGDAGYKGNTVATTAATSSTSVINIIAVEDLGDGLKATAKYGLDPRTLANDSLTTGGSSTTTTGLARDEVFVGLNGGFGNLRLGSPNSIGLQAFLATSPLGTGIGSGYAPAGAGTGAMNFVQTRYNRSVRYDSNNMAGWTVSVLHAPGAEALVTGVTAPSATDAMKIRKATELGLTYANGPLAVMLVNVSQAANASYAKSSSTVLGGQYNLGATTLYAAYIDGELLANTAGSATKATATRLAVKHTIGAVDLMASVQDAKATVAGTKQKTTGLRADYNLSKTAAVYAGYEDYDDKIAGYGNRKLTSFGLRKSF